MLDAREQAVGNTYYYIYARDDRVLCIHPDWFFILVNATDLNQMLYGVISGEAIRAGALFNDSHLVISTLKAHIVFINNSKDIAWQH